MMKFNFRQNPKKLQALIENKAKYGITSIREEEETPGGVNYFQ
jgi:hypothetical protein